MNPFSPLDSNSQLLSKVLDLRATKAEVISSNLANAETPGYAPSHFDFEEDLAAAMGSRTDLNLQTTASNHIPLHPTNFDSVEGKIIEEKDTSPIGDENGVSVDEEMVSLSENQILYETAAQLLKKKLSIYRYVVSDGGA